MQVILEEEVICYFIGNCLLQLAQLLGSLLNVVWEAIVNKRYTLILHVISLTIVLTCASFSQDEKIVTSYHLPIIKLNEVSALHLYLLMFSFQKEITYSRNAYFIAITSAVLVHCNCPVLLYFEEVSFVFYFSASLNS